MIRVREEIAYRQKFIDRDMLLEQAGSCPTIIMVHT